MIDLDTQSTREDFWDDTETAQQVLIKAASLREWIENWSDIDTKSATVLQLIEEANESDPILTEADEIHGKS